MKTIVAIIDLSPVTDEVLVAGGAFVAALAAIAASAILVAAFIWGGTRLVTFFKYLADWEAEQDRENPW
jgi:hypothetical protein